MEKNILNIYVLSRCGGSGFFVFNIKTLEPATNDGLDLAWDIKLRTTMLLAPIKSLSLLCSEPRRRICNIILMFFFLQIPQILTLLISQMLAVWFSRWKIFNIRPLELGKRVAGLSLTLGMRCCTIYKNIIRIISAHLSNAVITFSWRK